MIDVIPIVGNITDDFILTVGFFIKKERRSESSIFKVIEIIGSIEFLKINSGSPLISLIPLHNNLVTLWTGCHHKLTFLFHRLEIRCVLHARQSRRDYPV